MVNRSIRNFEIKELIATGGMAAIYKAVQVSLDRTVAIKILHGHLAQDKDFITRFEREAKAAANLKHENIVNIIDFGKTEDVYFIAMEYVDGKSLKDLMHTVDFMPCEIALTIAREISQGLDHAHKKGVVHRDIKPANILIGLDGTIKIADFGLAQAQDLISVTVTGSIVGTPAYMSPEQAGGKKIDHRSDLFSLGVVIYEMLTGRKPFSGQNYSSIIHEILTVVPPKPIEANPLIPREISAIIEKMLDKDPERRPQSAGGISDEITAYFRKLKIEGSRREVSQFLNAPENYLVRLKKERKEKHLERGLHFMGLGDEKIDDAISEFDKIIQLDPNDTRVLGYLKDLQARKAKKAAKPAAREMKKPPPVKPRPLPLLAIIGIPALVIALVLVIVFTRPKGKPVPVPKNEYGTVLINSLPSGAFVYLDTVLLGETPVKADRVIPGSHSLELTKAGYATLKPDFKVKAGDSLVLDYTLSLASPEKILKYGRLKVESVPSGAAVYLDNHNTGRTTPCSLDSVVVGQHIVKLIKAGYDPSSTTCKVTADKPNRVSVAMKPVVSEPVAGTSYMKVAVTPWAKIYIDNKYIETTPIAQSLTLTSGSHRIKLENPNYKVWEKTMPFPAGQTVTVDVKLEPLDGFLKITVKPWADVYIDGKFYETTPIAGSIKLPSGNHVLKLINPSFQIFEETVEISANNTLKKNVNLTPK
jgi:serine/threonine protein kinase